MIGGVGGQKKNKLTHVFCTPFSISRNKAVGTLAGSGEAGYGDSIEYDSSDISFNNPNDVCYSAYDSSFYVAGKGFYCNN